MTQKAKEGEQGGEKEQEKRLWGTPRTFDPLGWDKLQNKTQQRVLRRLGQAGRAANEVHHALGVLERARKGTVVERAAAIGAICVSVLGQVVTGGDTLGEIEVYLNAYRLRPFPVPLLSGWVEDRMLAERMPPTDIIRTSHPFRIGKQHLFARTPDHAETPGSTVSSGKYPNGVALLGGEMFMHDRAILAKWVLEKAGATDTTDLLQLTVGIENDGTGTMKRGALLGRALVPGDERGGLASLQALPERARTFSALAANPTPAEIAARLTPRKLDGVVRPVLLYGPSGTGKTVSAIQAVRTAFPGKRILLVTGAGLALLTQVPAQLSDLMDLLGTSALIVDDYVHSDPMLGHLRTFSLSGCPVLLTHMTTGLPSLAGLRPERLGGCLRFKGVTSEEDLRVILGQKLSLVPENVRAFLLDGQFPAAWVRDILDTLTEDEDLYSGEDSTARWATLLTTLTDQLLIATATSGPQNQHAVNEALIERLVKEYVEMTDPSTRNAEVLRETLYGGSVGSVMGAVVRRRTARLVPTHEAVGAMLAPTRRGEAPGAQGMEPWIEGMDEDLELSESDLRDMGIDADSAFLGRNAPFAKPRLTE